MKLDSFFVAVHSLLAARCRESVAAGSGRGREHKAVRLNFFGWGGSVWISFISKSAVCCRGSALDVFSFRDVMPPISFQYQVKPERTLSVNKAMLFFHLQKRFISHVERSGLEITSDLSLWLNWMRSWVLTCTHTLEMFHCYYEQSSLVTKVQLRHHGCIHCIQ